MALEDGERVGTAVLRFPPDHPVMNAAADACISLGSSVQWGQTGPELLTRLVRENGDAARAFPSSLLYPVHWTEWLDLVDPASAEAVGARLGDSAAIHFWNEKHRHHGFQPDLAPVPGCLLHTLAERHGPVGFRAADTRVSLRHIALVRELYAAKESLLRGSALETA